MKNSHKSGEPPLKKTNPHPTFFPPKDAGSFFPPASGSIQRKKDTSAAGQPIDDQIGKTVGALYGEDFSDVRIHNGEQGAAIAREQKAEAVTYGTNIAFDKGAYQPGTLLGSTLLAHELAHVAQQRGGQQSPPETSSTPDQNLEQHANFSAAKAAVSIKLGIQPGSNKGSGQAVKSRQRFSACPTTSNRIQPPSYLGTHSLETLQEINRIIDNTDLLARVVVIGVAVNAGTSSPEENIATGGPGDTIQAAAQALRGIPAIRRYRVHQEIGFLLLNHGNDLNDQERAFWDRVQRMFD